MKIWLPAKKNHKEKQLKNIVNWRGNFNRNKTMKKLFMNIVQPNHDSCSHIMAPAVIVWLL